MTLFTDNPFEKMMIQKPTGGVIMRRLFFIPRLVLPALIRDSPLVWGTVSERLKTNNRQNDKKIYLRYGI